MSKLPSKQLKHKKSKRPKFDKLRQALANETAKIITLEGLHDYQRAKIKASERLGNSQHGSLPSNFEIEQAIGSFQQTFVPNHTELIQAQREVALTIMQWFAKNSPYLTGPVADGVVGVNNIISIQLSSDTLESVVKELTDRNIKTDSHQRRLKLNNEFVHMPTICFEFQEFEIEVIVFSLRQQFQIPKSKSQNRSMRRVSTKRLQEMITSRR